MANELNPNILRNTRYNARAPGFFGRGRVAPAIGNVFAQPQAEPEVQPPKQVQAAEPFMFSQASGPGDDAGGMGIGDQEGVDSGSISSTSPTDADGNAGNTGAAPEGGNIAATDAANSATAADAAGSAAAAAAGAGASAAGQGDAGAAATDAGGAAAAAGAAAAGDAGGAGGGDGGGAGCFITEAVMAAGGQDDNAPELEALRSFRDGVMMTNPVGQALVQEYEELAPMVVESVSQRPDAIDIFASIKTQFIDKAVQQIQAGDNNGAFQTYAEMMAFVVPLAIGADTGMGGDPDDRVIDGQEGMDDFGDVAAFAAYSPELASAATGQNDMQHPAFSAPDDGMQQVPAEGLPPPEQAGIGQFVSRPY